MEWDVDEDDAGSACATVFDFLAVFVFADSGLGDVLDAGYYEAFDAWVYGSAKPHGCSFHLERLALRTFRHWGHFYLL